MATAASLAGISDNGLRWKAQIHGVSKHGRAVAARIDAGLTPDDIEPTTQHMRAIARAFRQFHAGQSALKVLGTSVVGDFDFAAEDALEWLEQDDPRFDIEEGDPDDFKGNWRHYMNALYDWADYERVVIL